MQDYMRPVDMNKESQQLAEKLSHGYDRILDSWKIITPLKDIISIDCVIEKQGLTVTHFRQWLEDNLLECGEIRLTNYEIIVTGIRSQR